MGLETKVFDVYNGKYRNLSELALAMGVSISQIYRVRRRERPINEKFICGAMKAFPEYEVSAPFYFDPEGSQNDHK